MTGREQGISWCQQGAQLFRACLDRVPDAAFGAASTLPGWTVGHLVAHVGYNAAALSRLMQWARTGVETPMYPSRDARNTEIEEGSVLPPEQLRTLVADTDDRLLREFAELPAAAWDNEIVTAQGVRRRAAEIPWMRTREVWVHAVDLGSADFTDFPADLIDALIGDTTGMRQRRQDAPALLVRPSDRDRTWQVEIPDARPSGVDGTAVDLCRWLTGRGELAGAPELSRWL